MEQSKNDRFVLNQVVSPFPVHDLPTPLLAKVFSHVVHEGVVNALFSLMRISRGGNSL